MISIREVEEKDIISLAEFMAERSPYTMVKGYPYTTREFWLSMFKYWWTANPAYTDQFPKGWILENESKPAGFIGNIPIKFLFRGEVRVAAAANHWYVDPSVRGLFSFRLFDQFVKQKHASLFLFRAGDDYKSYKNIMSRYKFEKYIPPVSQYEYVYIINKKQVAYVFSNFLVSLKISGLSEFLELYKRLGFLMLAYLYQKPVVQELPDEEYRSSVCTSCSDALSELWKPYLSSHEIALVRDKETLNWLYFSVSRLSERIVIQCQRSSDKKLAGYMVFDIQRLKSSDKGSMHLMETCIEDNNPRVLESLISYAIETGKQKETPLLVVWANSEEAEDYFRRTFSMRRTAGKHRYFRFFDDPEMISFRNEIGSRIHASMTWLKCISF